MKRILKYNLLTVNVLMLILIVSCQSKNSSLEEGPGGEETGVVVITKEQFKSSGMRMGDPEPMMFQQKITANGYIVASPDGIAQIGSLIPGKADHIMLKAGDYVKKGQLLFTLESNEIILIQQEYAVAFNQLSAVKANYERQKVLAKEQITSQKDFINTESGYRSLLAKVDGLKARLRMINIEPAQVEKGNISPVATISSPIQGYVTKQNLVLGQYIEPQRMVMEIINMDKLQLNIYVFEKDLKDMVIGQQVIFFDPVDMNRIFEAKLSHIGKSINPDTKTVQCIAQLMSDDRSAFVNNMFVETEIITCQREAPAIPSEALIKEEDRYYVLSRIDEKDGNLILRKTPVNIGVVTEEYAEVLDEGLKNILIVGAYNLSVSE